MVFSRFPSRELKEIDDITLVLQHNMLRWCGQPAILRYPLAKSVGARGDFWHLVHCDSSCA